MNRSMLITIVVLAALAIGVPSATAGGSTNAAPEPSSSPAWVTASPDPAVAGSRIELSGCGYDVKPAEVRITHSAGYTEIYGVGMWSTGCFSGTFFSQEAGAYTIDVYQDQRNARKPMLLKASTTLTVR